MSLKFKVKNLEQFKRLQKVLFKLGYTFGNSSTEIKNCPNTRFVYVENNNKIYVGLSSSIFKDDPAVEKDTQKFIAGHIKRLKRKPQC